MGQLTRHYVGAIGTEIIVDCQQDISGSLNTKFYIQKPNGDEVEWAALVYNLRYLRHLTIASDFSEPGSYSLQPYIERLGWKGKGRTVVFHIYDEFQ